MAQAEHIPRSAEARLLLFAQCAGRFSAEMEHAWLLGQHNAFAEDGRRVMVDFIDAIGPVAGFGGQDILAMRIEAKMAHARLLTRATFGREPHARHLAQRYVDGCSALLPAPLDLVLMR